MKTIDWSPWLIRMSQGDEEAFRMVYETTKDHAYRLIYYLSPSKADVPDIMSEVYIELLRNVRKYRHELSFEAWFNGLIVRQVRNWKRKSWRLFRTAEKLKLVTSPNDSRASDSFTAISEQMELVSMLNKLPQKAKEVIVLRYYQDYSLEDIANALSIPLGTVKSRHHHALKLLRRRCEEVGEGKEREGYVY